MMGPIILGAPKTTPLPSTQTELARYVRLEFGDETPAWLLADLTTVDGGYAATVPSTRTRWVASIRRVAKSVAAFLL